MKKIILLIIPVLFGCLSKNTVTRKTDIESDFKLKIGPLWYTNENEIDIVFGVENNEIQKNYITELHLNFGGKTECETQKMIAKIEFGQNNFLILPDSINKLLPSSSSMVKREKKDSSVAFEFFNPNPGILVFTIEKLNLKPNGERYKTHFNLNSSCNQTLVSIPINLSKYKANKIEDLYENYIKTELSKISNKKLINKKIIFSFNEVLENGEYLVDLVDQRNMLILSYEYQTNEYLLHNFDMKLIKKIKRN